MVSTHKLPLQSIEQSNGFFFALGFLALVEHVGQDWEEVNSNLVFNVVTTTLDVVQVVAVIVWAISNAWNHPISDIRQWVVWKLRVNDFGEQIKSSHSFATIQENTFHFLAELVWSNWRLKDCQHWHVARFEDVFPQLGNIFDDALRLLVGSPLFESCLPIALIIVCSNHFLFLFLGNTF